jgi:transcriptional regulator with XRE-family HTH domain
MSDYDTPFGRFYRGLPHGEPAELARKAGISRQYLWALASGNRQAGMAMAARLMAADDRITLGMLRPDFYED